MHCIRDEVASKQRKCEQRTESTKPLVGEKSHCEAKPILSSSKTSTDYDSLSTGVRRARERNSAHEELHENPVFHFGRSGVHGLFCGRQASRLQKERQELSDERQQGMQLREGVRLQGSK